MMKQILVAGTWVFFLAFTACNNKPCSTDSKCTEFSPVEAGTTTCAMVVQGYYYDTKTNRCIYYSGSGCDLTPFKTKEECEHCECR